MTVYIFIFAGIHVTELSYTKTGHYYYQYLNLYKTYKID